MTDRHHNAPPLAERLEIDHATLASDAKAAAALVPAEVRAITSDDEAGDYAETAKALKTMAALIETNRKREKDQIIKDGRTVDAFFTAISDPVRRAADKVLSEINRYQTAKLQAERKAAAEREEAERRAATPFDEPPAPPAPVVAKEAARVTSFSGVKATASTKWLHEVTDAAQVPRQYLAVNDAAIKAAIAGGTREIPGVRIYESIRTAIR